LRVRVQHHARKKTAYETAATIHEIGPFGL
jgi:hypothetical protein